MGSPGLNLGGLDEDPVLDASGGDAGALPGPEQKKASREDEERLHGDDEGDLSGERMLQHGGGTIHLAADRSFDSGQGRIPPGRLRIASPTTAHR